MDNRRQNEFKMKSAGTFPDRINRIFRIKNSAPNPADPV
jgi:hypothetical protein